jgi:hypothetical protein
MGMEKVGPELEGCLRSAEAGVMMFLFRAKLKMKPSLPEVLPENCFTEHHEKQTDPTLPSYAIVPIKIITCAYQHNLRLRL